MWPVQHMRDEDAPPAEWRWTTQEVCDDRWHHYTITYEKEKVPWE